MHVVHPRASSAVLPQPHAPRVRIEYASSTHRVRIVSVRSHHWRFGNMPPVAGITRAEVVSIVTYFRTLQRANGIN